MAPRIKVLLLASPPPDFWEEEAMKLIAPRHQVVRFDPQQDPVPQMQGVDAVLDIGGPKDKRPLADLLSGSVKLWQLVSTGFDNFDVDYWRERRIPVANTPGGSSAVSLAECALMLMIMVSRRWPEAQALLRDRVVGRPKGLDLENRRLGLVGFGASAIELARRAKSFSMKISAIDIRSISPEEQEELGVDFVGGPDELDQVIGHSDYLSLHLHLNRETRHTIDARRLRLMKPTAHLINVARGALVDQEALYEALIEKQLAGAGLDVFAEEPVDPDSPLLQLPNLVAAPHIAGQTQETAERRAAMAAENLDRVARGLDPIYRIDR